MKGQNAEYTCTVSYADPPASAQIIAKSMMSWSHNGVIDSAFSETKTKDLTVPTSDLVLPPYTCSVTFDLTSTQNPNRIPPPPAFATTTGTVTCVVPETTVQCKRTTHYEHIQTNLVASAVQ